MAYSPISTGFIVLSLLCYRVHGNYQHQLFEKATENVGNEECDLFRGTWVSDESYPVYNSSQCTFIEREFTCIENGRPDQFYLKFRWQPSDCNLTRFDGGDFLERYRGKSFMFVGDSLSLNQWQSLTCMLHVAVPDANYTLVRAGGLSTFTFQDKVMGNTLYQELCRQGLYPIPFDLPHQLHSDSSAQATKTASIHSRTTQTAFLGKCVKHSLWHKILGHASNIVVQHMLKKCDIVSLPSSESVCEDCLLGKFHKLPFESSSTKSSAPFDLVHSDVWGPSLMYQLMDTSTLYSS